MGAYGYRGVERTILQAARGAATFFPNRAAGERMTGAADYFRRYSDRGYVVQMTSQFRHELDSFDRQLRRSKTGLLKRERYGADILGPIYGLHAQVIVLQGLRGMSEVWARAGYPRLAVEAADVATRLEAGVRAAVANAQAHAPGGPVV